MVPGLWFPYHLIGQPLDANEFLELRETLMAMCKNTRQRLVAKGFHQREGLDFGEIFCPVVKLPM